MTSRLDTSVRVAYHRDAKIFPSLEAQAMELKAAIEVAIKSHRLGECPAIIGTKLQLIGIGAIIAARNAAKLA